MQKCLALSESNDFNLTLCDFKGGIQRVVWTDTQQLSVGGLCLAVSLDVDSGMMKLVLASYTVMVVLLLCCDGTQA
jgi:hypothetical protein